MISSGNSTFARAMRFLMVAACFPATFFFGTTQLFAQESGNETGVSWVPPATPAFTYLGVSPTDVQRPTSPRALGTDLINGIDGSGAVKQGLAFDFAPWSTIPGLSITLKDYQDKFGSFVAANTQISLATVKASGVSSNTDLALGIHIVLANGADPMLDRAGLEEYKRKRCPDPTDPAELDAFTRCADSLWKQFRSRYLKEHWNSGGLTIAAATGWTLDRSRIDKGNYSGARIWGTGSLGLGDWGQLLASAAYSSQRFSSDSSSTSFIAAVKALAGAPTWNFFLEYSLRFLPDNGTGDKVKHTYAFGIEYRLADGLWLSTGFGRQSAQSESDNVLGFLANLKWVISDGPRINMK